jgi:hypothetical protein
MKAKSKRGGHRPGAGRKPIGDKPMLRKQVLLTDENIAKANAKGGGNLSLGIRIALDET